MTKLNKNKENFKSTAVQKQGDRTKTKTTRKRTLNVAVSPATPPKIKSSEAVFSYAISLPSNHQNNQELQGKKKG